MIILYAEILSPLSLHHQIIQHYDKYNKVWLKSVFVSIRYYITHNADKTSNVKSLVNVKRYEPPNESLITRYCELISLDMRKCDSRMFILSVFNKSAN